MALATLAFIFENVASIVALFASETAGVGLLCRVSARLRFDVVALGGEMVVGTWLLCVVVELKLGFDLAPKRKKRLGVGFEEEGPGMSRFGCPFAALDAVGCENPAALRDDFACSLSSIAK